MMKNIVSAIDNAFFGASIQKWYGMRMTSKKQTLFEDDLDFRFVSYYQKNLSCELSALCDLYGTDKGELQKFGHPYSWASHNYADFYARHFEHCRNSVKNIFECGLGTNNPNLLSSMGISGKPGASLRVWRDYFPNAMVYGADIDQDVLFEEERIKTYFIDQLDLASIKRYWDQVNVNDFDLMVDDGLHTFEAGVTLFLGSVDRLANSGIYVIEDVTINDLVQYKDFFQGKSFFVEYISLYRPSIDLIDNSLVVVRKQN
jgi:hypothetical protein